MNRFALTLAVSLLTASCVPAAFAGEVAKIAPAPSCTQLVATLSAEQFATLRDRGALRLDAAAATAEQAQLLDALKTTVALAPKAQPREFTLKMASRGNGVPELQLWATDRSGKSRQLQAQPLALAMR